MSKIKKAQDGWSSVDGPWLKKQKAVLGQAGTRTMKCGGKVKKGKK